MDAAPYLSGQLLLAMPGIGDPRFERAVIALCAHDDDGALGIGIGALMKGIGFHDLLRQLDIDPGVAPDVSIHFGGPVDMQRGFVLHSQDWGGEDSFQIGRRWSLTSTRDVLKAIAEGRGPSRWLVALGYAGWGEGQLDEEMTRHGWFATPGDDDIVFDRPVASRWPETFAAAGIDPRLLIPTTGTA